jgi:hypothetical protein
LLSKSQLLERKMIQKGERKIYKEEEKEEE